MGHLSEPSVKRSQGNVRHAQHVGGSRPRLSGGVGGGAEGLREEEEEMAKSTSQSNDTIGVPCFRAFDTCSTVARSEKRTEVCSSLVEVRRGCRSFNDDFI